MNVKIELNDSPSDNLRQSAQRHIDAGAGESLEEAFERILGGKNISETDRRRILAVKEALIEGTIARESKAYNKQGVLKRLGKAEVMRLYKTIEEREKAETLRKMVEEMPDNYDLITERYELNEWLDFLREESVIPIDVETTGTDIWSDYIVGYVISNVTHDRHCYIPTRHETDEQQLDHDEVTADLRELLEQKDVLYVGHNINYDLHMLLNEGITVQGTLWDTMEGMKLLNENESTYALKHLATKYLNMPSKTYGELFGNIGFHEVSDLKLATAYAAKDGDITYKLYEFQRKHLQERFPTIYEYAVNVEMPLIYSVIDMERNGFNIDVEFAEKYGKELMDEQVKVAERITKILGDINLNSPSQLKPALEEHTKRTLASTDAKALKKLSKDFAVVADILRYKEISKLYGTYVSKLPKAISEKTGRLMASYSQNGAKTGRFSSGGAAGNLQNQNEESQKLFVAPPGKVWIEADFSAQEIRAVAYLSKEPVLIEAFQKGLDAYAMMGSKFYGKPYEEVYKNPDGSDTAERKTMKITWLATLYGMSNFSLAEMLGVSKKEADKLQKELFESMPKLSAWIEQTKTYAQRNGYVWMDKKQRKRRLPEATQRRYDIPYGKYDDPAYEKQRLHNSAINRSLRQAANAVVQGSSAIQTKLTMIKAHEVCQQREGWAISNIIHDAIFWEVPEDFTQEDAELITRVMTETYPWGDEIPNKTDLEVMYRWSEGVSIDDWFKGKR